LTSFLGYTPANPGILARKGMKLGRVKDQQSKAEEKATLPFSGMKNSSYSFYST